MSKKYYKVWNVEFDENRKTATVDMTRSRKARDNEYDKRLENAGGVRNGYIQEFKDSYVQFAGKAFNQLKKYEVKSGDTIIADVEVFNEPYVDKDGNLAYLKGFRHKVFEFELPGSSQDGTTPANTNQIKNFDRDPRVGADTQNTDKKDYSEPVPTDVDDDLPF